MRRNILIVHWSPNKLRAAEFTECMEHNLKIGFDEVLIVNSGSAPNFFGTNITNVTIDDRMTFKHFVLILNQQKYRDWGVITANTDIKLDPTIIEVTHLITSK